MVYILSCLAFSLPFAFVIWIAVVSFVYGFRRYGIEKGQFTGKVLGILFFGSWILLFILVIIFGERRISGASSVFAFPLFIGILFWITSLKFGDSTIELKKTDVGLYTSDNTNQDATEPKTAQTDKLKLGKESKEFPYKAELDRKIFSHLLKEDKDEATMLQAKVLCDGDTEKAEAMYYKLRYQQIVESGEIEEFRKAILAEKRQQIVLRSQPCEVSKSDLKNMLMKYDFFDNTQNRQGFFENDFVDNGNGTVTDKSTGLMWQKGGYNYETKFYEAKLYIDDINRTQYIGYSDWRIPTIEELASLLAQPTKTPRVLFIDQMFKKEQTVCWSSDSKNKINVWLANFKTGDIFWGYDRDNYYIRAVRSIA